MGAAAGVDSVGHGVGDALVDDELLRLMRAKGTDYIATLVVFEPQQARVMSPAELAQLNPPQRAAELAREAQADKTVLPYDAKRWAIMQENIRRLKRRKSPLASGPMRGSRGSIMDPGRSARSGG